MYIRRTTGTLAPLHPIDIYQLLLPRRAYASRSVEFLEMYYLKKGSFDTSYSFRVELQNAP